MKEHGLPLVRYYCATFMRGNWRRCQRREGLAHIIRRNAHLYLSGHQHLFACLRLSKKNRPANETNCSFLIVGASSQLDDGGSRSGSKKEEEEEEEEEEENEEEDDDSFPETDVGKVNYVSSSSVDFGMEKSERYDYQWRAPPAFGFAVVDVTPSRLVTRCFFSSEKGLPREVQRYVMEKQQQE